MKRIMPCLCLSMSVAAAALAQSTVLPIEFLAADSISATDGNQTLELADIAAADLDGDDDLDLVVCSTNLDLDSPPVIILENNGSGTFSVGDELDLRTRPSAIAVADLNGDDTPDLAITLLGDDEVAVLIGAGSGTFLNAVRYATGNAPTHVAVGDVNGDGAPDLVTSNPEDDTLTVLINTGNADGDFEDPVDVNVRLTAGATRSEPTCAAIADFDGDGQADIVTTLSLRDQVGLLINAGGGAFTGVTETFDVGTVPTAIAAGLIDDDDNPDAVVANSVGDTVQVLLGDGAGGFNVGDAVNAGNRPEDVELADADEDGALDVITANLEGDSVSVLAGVGDGNLQAADSFSTGNGPTGLALGDFDDDGRLDIATANFESGADDDADVSLLIAGSASDGGDIGDVIGDCGSACGPLGSAPLVFTLLGIIGMKQGGVRRAARRRG
ncbi:MAG: VCBS repeat-containing protein [Phycisphaerae bacterium]|jgi:hypothetical protein